MSRLRLGAGLIVLAETFVQQALETFSPMPAVVAYGDDRGFHGSQQQTLRTDSWRARSRPAVKTRTNSRPSLGTVASYSWPEEDPADTLSGVTNRASEVLVELRIGIVVICTNFPLGGVRKSRDLCRDVERAEHF